MVEQKSAQDPVYFFLPRSEYDLNRQATETVTKLVTHPDKLREFTDLIKDSVFLAEAKGEGQTKAMLQKYVKSVADNIEGYKWEKRHGDKLSVDVAREMMTSLPDADRKSTSSLELDLDRVTLGMMKGLLEKRFEKDHDWRGCMTGVSRLVEAVADSDITSGLFKKYLDLMMGKYNQIMQADGFGMRAFFVASRAVSPSDEGSLGRAVELARCTEIVAELLGRSNETDVFSRKNEKLSIQYSTLSAMFSTGLDVNDPIGKEVYEFSLRKGVDESNRRHNQSENKLNFEEVSRMKLWPEVLEVAGQHQQYPGRGMALVHAMDRTDKPDIGKGMETFKMPDDSEDFPYTAMSKISPEREKLTRLLSIVTIKKRLRNYADDVVALQGGKWIVKPFAVEGYAGYIVGDPVETGIRENMRPGEEAVAVKNFLTKGNLQKRFRDEFPQSNLTVDAGFLRGKGYEILLFSEDRSDKTKEEMALDLHVPDALRSRSIEILGEVTKLRLSIPREFTQMPTKSGYLFNLEDHPDLPGVFNEALVKLDETGGIAVRFQLSWRDVAFVKYPFS